MASERIVLVDSLTNERFQFPVNPERITIRNAREFAKAPVIGKVASVIPGSMEPEALSFSSFFPRDYDSGYVNYVNIEDPDDSVTRLQRWMGRIGRGRQISPTPLIVRVTGTDFSQRMVITEFTTERRGGEPGDVYFTITLSQFRQQRVRVLTATDTGDSDDDSDDEVPSPNETTYEVVTGDTLSSIANKFYGDSSKWPTIYEANESVIGPNPNLIFPGMVLVIP